MRDVFLACPPTTRVGLVPEVACQQSSRGLQRLRVPGAPRPTVGELGRALAWPRRRARERRARARGDEQQMMRDGCPLPPTTTTTTKPFPNPAPYLRIPAAQQFPLSQDSTTTSDGPSKRRRAGLVGARRQEGGRDAGPPVVLRQGARHPYVASHPSPPASSVASAGTSEGWQQCLNSSCCHLIAYPGWYGRVGAEPEARAFASEGRRGRASFVSPARPDARATRRRLARSPPWRPIADLTLSILLPALQSRSLGSTRRTTLSSTLPGRGPTSRRLARGPSPTS